MDNLISIRDWAIKNGITPATARQRAIRGSFKTARKIGKNWVIDKDEELVDNRRRVEEVYMVQGIVKELRYSVATSSIEFALEGGYKYDIYSVKPDNIHFGGKNCEIKQLVIGSKILFNPGKKYTEVTILSDGIREVDEDGNLIKW